MVEQLLAVNPALIDAVTIDGHTPLHSALRAGRVAMGSYLLDVKPDLISIKDNRGNTPLHIVVKYVVMKRR